MVLPEKVERGWRGSAHRERRARYCDRARTGGINANLVRHQSEHNTVTIVMYYVVKGGVPSEEDARQASHGTQHNTD